MLGRQPVSAWEDLFDLAPCGLIWLDTQGTIRAINRAAARLLGINQDGAIGQPAAEVVPGWNETPFSSTPSALFHPQAPESVVVDLPGLTTTKLRLCATSISNGTRDTQGLLLSMAPCTDVATLERQLHRAEYQAAMGKLARGIAHELNGPLDGVLRYLHLALEQLTEDSPVREYLVHVRIGLDRMVRAVRSFLECSRQAATPVTRIADLNTLIEDALVLVQHRATFQHVRVVTHCHPALPAVLDGGLQHAILNLLKNAFDAMPRGGTLTVTSRHTGSSVEVEIEDTGTGIPPEIRSRLFEAFFSTKPAHLGSGLGLNIAKEAVERSGGTIEFQSSANVGTTFRIRVPSAPSEERPHGA